MILFTFIIIFFLFFFLKWISKKNFFYIFVFVTDFLSSF